MSDKSLVMRPLGIVDPPVPRVGPFPQAKSSASPAALLAAALVFIFGAKVFGPAWAQTIFAAASLSRPSDAGSLAAAFILTVLLHEMGHLVAAVALRFDILAINLGPVRYSRSDGNWTLHWKSHGWWAASVVAVPALKQRGDEDRWRRDMLLVIAAGPLATLLATAVPVYLLLATGPGVSGRTAVAFLAELNAILFLFGLIPNGPGAATRNDASLLAALVSNGAEGREILLYQMLVQLTTQGFRPCYYPERVVREMAWSRTRADFTAVFAEAISQWAWDRGDVVTAEAWLERSLEAVGFCEERLQSRIRAQYACFCLLVYGDRTHTRLHLEAVCLPTLVPIWLRHRTAAVAALTQWKRQQAETELRQAEAAFQQHVSYFEFERKLIRGLRSLVSVAR